MALLERPDGTGVSRTKLTALAAMAYPLIEPYLESGSIDPEQLRRFAPYILLGLGLYYLRAAIKGNPPNLDKLLESYQGIHARLAQVQEEREEERRKRENAEAFYQELQQELEKRPPLRRGDVRADDPPPQEPE